MGSPIRIRCATSRGRTRRTASRLRRGPVPRRRAFGSGETVARFGVRETIELVRRFFNISGQNSHFASGARGRRGIFALASLSAYAERSAVRLGL